MTPSQKFTKRGFDLLMSSLGLLLLWPVMAAAALAVRGSDGGPALFRQKRVGKDGVLFDVLKFRTMYLTDRPGSTVTVLGDRRITPVGEVLRKWKLDELPQLWNVLRGDMSFVGPRPDVPGFADQLSGQDRVILTVRPGVTGPATLKYRNEEELLARQQDPDRYNSEVIYPDKVRLNRAYVEQYCFWKDMKYILSTIFD